MRKMNLISIGLLLLAAPYFAFPVDEFKSSIAKSEKICRKYASKYLEVNEKIETNCNFDESSFTFKCLSSDGSFKDRYFASNYYFVKEGIDFQKTYAIGKKSIDANGDVTQEVFHYDNQLRYASSKATIFMKDFSFNIHFSFHSWDSLGRNTEGTVSAILKECTSLPIEIEYNDGNKQLSANYGTKLEGLSAECRLFTMSTKEKFDSDLIQIHDLTQYGDSAPKENKYEIIEKKEYCTSVIKENRIELPANKL